MRTFGLYLVIFSLISIVLAVIGLDLPVVSKLDSWGLPKGILIRVAFVMIGIILMAGNKQKLPEEQFPELKEINKLSESNTAEGETGSTDA